MYAVVEISDKHCAKEIDLTNNEDIGWIQSYTESGEPVILVEDLEDLDSMGIDYEEVDIINN